jgi:hypothetical protein
MKQHRTHQRHSRSHTPSVICLPPPTPPVTPKRATIGATSALKLPKADDPLTLSRQVRRQQQRRNHIRAAVEPTAPAPVAVAEPVGPLAAPVPVTSSVPIDADAPLPRNRSLAPTRKGIAAALIGWLRKPAWKTPKRGETTAISQLQALRDEVAALQISLDRALEGLAA